MYKAEGIILRVRVLGEADKIAVVLTQDEGKPSIVARGARRPRNRFVGATQPFTHLRYMAMRGKGLDTLSQVEIVNSYAGLREDLDRTAYASYFAELVDELVRDKDRDAASSAYPLLLRVFHVLNRARPAPGLRHAFELRLLSGLGYRPELDACLECGRPVASFVTAGVSQVRFHPERGGLVCPDCSSDPSGTVRLSPQGVIALRNLMRLDAESALATELPSQVAQETDRAMREYIEVRLERRLRSLDFLHDVAGTKI